MYVEDGPNNLLCRHHDDAACSDDAARGNDSSSSSRLNSMDEEYNDEDDDGREEEEEGEGEGEGEGEREEIPSGPSRDWLRLGPVPPPSANVLKRPHALRELDFFGDRASSSSSSSPSAAAPVIQLFPSAPVPWGSWSGGGSSSGELAGRGNSDIFQHPHMPATAVQFSLPSGRTKAAACAGMRVVSPPRRQTGVWLKLEAAKDQGGRQPVLPQIPNNYLRIKDGGRLSVELLIKYLVKKLDLEDESEVEVTCRGQQLRPCLTLQHVRDSVWRRPQQSSATPLPDSGGGVEPHMIMKLQYRRSAQASYLIHSFHAQRAGERRAAA